MQTNAAANGTHVDRTSAYGLQMALTTDSPGEWALRSFYELTLLLLMEDDVYLPGPPGPPASQKGPGALLLEGVKPFKTQDIADEMAREKARKQADTWVSGNLDRIAGGLQRIRERENVEYDPWLD